jgi:hypothetical protein
MEERNCIMRHVKVTLACAWTLTLLLAGAPGSAQQTSPTAAPDSAAQAMAVLQRMAELLSQAQRFSVTADIGFDAVQDSGQKIEFGETRKVVLRRPDRLRIDAVKRDGSQSVVLFDGKAITVVHPQENVYATAARPGSVDAAMAYFVHDLGLRLPLAELVNSHLAQRLPEQVRDAAYVESSSIAGVPCDHLALRGDEADLQVWIAQGQQPLPRRLVITYRHADGRPQFWAQFSDWNLEPAVPDALFAFTPPTGTAQIAFSPRQMLQPEATTTTGGK